MIQRFIMIKNELTKTDLTLRDFHYELPEERIAQTPVEPRDSSRLMVIDREKDSVEHKVFRDIIDYLRPEDVLVMGNISPVDCFRNGNPEIMRSAVTALIDECGKYPNFSISSGCDIPPLTPWENIDAFFSSVAEYYK